MVRMFGRLILVLAVMAAVFAARDGNAAVLARWAQYDASDAVEVRVVTDAASCPSLTVDGKPAAMAERAAPDKDFPRVCAARLPAGSKSASVEGAALPLPATDPQTILVLGDTGCRIKLVWTQACNDPAQWPFAKNAASAAALKPALVIHVGDYHYRESPCPPGISGCAGSPYGDNWAAWNADFFAPAAPLLAAAPWVMVRGNHEDCQRAGKGWNRLIGPGPYDPAKPCPDHQPPYAVSLGAERLIVLDSAIAPDPLADPRIVPIYRKDFAEVARLADRPSWLVTHRPIWGIVGQAAARVVGGNATMIQASGRKLPPQVGLQLAGHIHVLQVTNFANGLPPQIIAGHGGDDLDTRAPKDLAGLTVGRAKVEDGFSMDGFGFLTFTRQGEGWAIAMYDTKGKIERRCTLVARRVGCPAS
jgi:hypothetical protein